MNLPIRRLALITATLCTITLTGCGIGNLAPSTPVSTSMGTIQGKAFGGNQPIVGSSIYVYAASTSGYGGASTLLSTTVPTTDSNGNFTITTDYTCTAGQQVYLYASGGNPGGGTANSAAGLLAILGTCPASGSMATVTPFVFMNEVTTVAAAYAFSGFATDATHVSDDEGVVANTTTALAATGMANAFANAANLVNVSTGTALTTTGNLTTIVVPQAQINTVANILANCVNSGSSTSSNCSTLLQNATSDGTPTGVQPSDTATAAINIAHHPTSNVAALYGVIAGQPVFPTYDTTQPADFTISILFPQGGTGTVGLAIDGNGNAFATYGGGNLVYKITPAAVLTSTSSVSSSGDYIAAPRHLAVDGSNNVWVPSLSSSSTTGTIVEFSNSLAVMAQCNAVDTTASVSAYSLNAIAIAQNGNIWAEGAKSAAPASSNAVEVTPSCTSVTSITGLPAGTTTDIAINPNGYIAIPSTSSGKYLSIFNSSGTAITNSPFTGGGLAAPAGVITDATGNFWVADGAGGVSVLTQAGGIVSTSAYPTGSLAILDGDFDGLGNYFIGSSSTATTTGTIYELNSSGSLVATFTPPTNTNNYDAVDPSGNLWYGGNKYICEMIGIAAPKVTPIVTATFGGKLATRP